ncbi:hypothetical protein [Brevundimonas sp.]|uniref:hypothetical protein n=1 Tax=Brevundimonas sp. TaxID=1871086 RepID=UPI002D5738F9|nr:hypothetical protein [Brevundimonas sp.]HYD27429.1 hypothetical protein [Brevundimonas sp.]
MPHQNVHSSKATAQNAATDPVGPGDQTRAGGETPRPEPRSYAAPDVADSSLAPPAAGEVADYMDEGDPLAADDVQLGGTNRNRPERTEKMDQQGPKTRAGNRNKVRTGSAG